MSRISLYCENYSLIDLEHVAHKIEAGKIRVLLLLLGTSYSKCKISIRNAVRICAFSENNGILTPDETRLISIG